MKASCQHKNLYRHGGALCAQPMNIIHSPVGAFLLSQSTMLLQMAHGMNTTSAKRTEPSTHAEALLENVEPNISPRGAHMTPGAHQTAVNGMGLNAAPHPVAATVASSAEKVPTANSMQTPVAPVRYRNTRLQPVACYGAGAHSINACKMLAFGLAVGRAHCPAVC